MSGEAPPFPSLLRFVWIDSVLTQPVHKYKCTNEALWLQVFRANGAVQPRNVMSSLVCHVTRWAAPFECMPSQPRDYNRGS